MRTALNAGLPAASLVCALLLGCGPGGGPVDPDTAPRALVDRFSDTAGTLMVRDAANGLPAAGAPIDFDAGPFVTHGLGPAGESVRYYNFDVQPDRPADIYVFFREGESEPLEGQLNVVDVVPGDPGYSDFWRVSRVDVAADYEANTLTSLDEILAEGLSITAMETVVNCPIVPEGSTATRRLGGGATGTQRGWYRGMLVHYFSFEEGPLAVDGAGVLPTSPIYVTFNVNPDQPDGGPQSGFVTEAGSDQTHNVVGSTPGGGYYSPLWSVNVYDNADFDVVGDLPSASAATLLAADVVRVNCPLVEMN